MRLVKVLWISHFPVFGGPHNNLMRLASPLADRGWETLALVPTEPGTAAARLREGGIEVMELPLRRLRATTNPTEHLRTALAYPRDVWRIRSLIRAPRGSPGGADRARESARHARGARGG